MLAFDSAPPCHQHNRFTEISPAFSDIPSSTVGSPRSILNSPVARFSTSVKCGSCKVLSNSSVARRTISRCAVSRFLNVIAPECIISVNFHAHRLLKSPLGCLRKAIKGESKAENRGFPSERCVRCVRCCISKNTICTQNRPLHGGEPDLSPPTARGTTL